MERLSIFLLNKNSCVPDTSYFLRSTYDLIALASDDVRMICAALSLLRLHEEEPQSYSVDNVQSAVLPGKSFLEIAQQGKTAGPGFTLLQVSEMNHGLCARYS